MRELHREKKILDYKECKTIRYCGAWEFRCYKELAFVLQAKPSEKVKIAINVLEESINDPFIVPVLQIPRFLNGKFL